MARRFPFYEQLDASDCGPTCLRMVCRYFGRDISINYIRKITFLQRQGTSLLGLSQAAESLGMKTMGVKITQELLRTQTPLPAILFWNQNHYVILYKVKRKSYLLGDPGRGLITVSEAELRKSWLVNEQGEGIALLLDPTERFFNPDNSDSLDQENKERRIWELWPYVRKFRRYFGLLITGMLLGSLLQLLPPFLTQAMIDQGVQNQDLSFVNLILLSLLLIFIASTFIDALRNWLLLHISSRLNITILSEFIYKLLKLPLHFFDTRMKGDIIQRLNDHTRIQQFLTSNTLTTLFSLFNVVVFSIALALYSKLIFLVFLSGSILSILWILYFFRARRIIDNTHFRLSAKSQNIIYELVDGIHELKLTNSEIPYKWKWENIQSKVFHTSLRALHIEQWQSIGNASLNEGKNILISYLAATQVIEGKITLGIMLAIAYITGSLNGPISQIIAFFRSAQNASISLRRLNEVQSLKNEDEERIGLLKQPELAPILANGDILVNHLQFSYDGPGGQPVFSDLNLRILNGKVNAIVGVSGSGKTTLLKLLTKFYSPQDGDIQVGDLDLASIDHTLWRSLCGVVMQDGYIFGDTIAHNIAIGSEEIDYNRLIQAAKIANIHDFINSLALGYQSKIGSEGTGISQGQKQRILIARAVYKNPAFILFDEATSSLDANNESKIMHHLDAFFRERTAIIVAHRLSTVRHADQIIVLDQGKVVETGSHESLVAQQGIYYRLINKQLF
ncbi:MAG: peptidase domain-containing ABC transporter [Lewinellaceae bacterium]|nr:peptidase domain-containing ABC transporter [Lewinellaceae bacterium]